MGWTGQLVGNGKPPAGWQVAALSTQANQPGSYLFHHSTISGKSSVLANGSSFRPIILTADRINKPVQRGQVADNGLEGPVRWQ